MSDRLEDSMLRLKGVSRLEVVVVVVVGPFEYIVECSWAFALDRRWDIQVVVGSMIAGTCWV